MLAPLPSCLLNGFPILRRCKGLLECLGMKGGRLPDIFLLNLVSDIEPREIPVGAR